MMDIQRRHDLIQRVNFHHQVSRKEMLSTGSLQGLRSLTIWH
jgi:hypothetical protein